MASIKVDDFSVEETSYIVAALSMKLASVERAIKAASDPDIVAAYQKQLSKYSALLGKFR